MITLLQRILSGARRQESPADAEHRKRIAACVLLLEAAHADDDFSPLEKARIVDTVTARFALAGEDAAELLELANRERQNSVDLWQFTNSLNQVLSEAEKRVLIEDVWGIIFADGHLEGHEDHLAHKLANLLRLTHQELIAAKLAAKARA